jgi:hypothetical protein
MGKRFGTLFCLLMAVTFACASLDAALAQSPAPAPSGQSGSRGGAQAQPAAAPPTIPRECPERAGAPPQPIMPIVDQSGSSTIVLAPDGERYIAVDKDGNVLGEAERNEGADKDFVKWNVKKLTVPLSFLAPAAGYYPTVAACSTPWRPVLANGQPAPVGEQPPGTGGPAPSADGTPSDQQPSNSGFGFGGVRFGFGGFGFGGSNQGGGYQQGQQRQRSYEQNRQR